MEFIEISIVDLSNYNNHLIKNLKSSINQSITCENLIKPFGIINKIISVFTDDIKEIPKDQFGFLESVLNEVYSCLKKMEYSLFAFLTSSLFSQDKKYKSISESAVRNEIYLRSILEDINYYKETYKNSTSNYSNDSIEAFINKKFVNNIQLSSKTRFLLKLEFGKNTPNSTENLFSNLILFKVELDGVSL